MNLLLQIIFMCGLFLVMGSNASGDRLSEIEMDAERYKFIVAIKNNHLVLAKEIVTPLAEKGHAKS
jgi:hypothetical protein